MITFGGQKLTGGQNGFSEWNVWSVWTELSWIRICSSRRLLVRIRALLLRYGNIALSSDLYEPQLGRLSAALRHTRVDIRRPQPCFVAGGVFINLSILPCNKLVQVNLIALSLSSSIGGIIELFSAVAAVWNVIYEYSLQVKRLDIVFETKVQRSLHFH